MIIIIIIIIIINYIATRDQEYLARALKSMHKKATNISKKKKKHQIESHS